MRRCRAERGGLDHCGNGCEDRVAREGRAQDRDVVRGEQVLNTLTSGVGSGAQENETVSLEEWREGGIAGKVFQHADTTHNGDDRREKDEQGPRAESEHLERDGCVRCLEDHEVPVAQ